MCKLSLELYINILISDMVTKMLQLEQIFKKYEVRKYLSSNLSFLFFNSR